MSKTNRGIGGDAPPFDIATCRDMLSKLGRELDRLKAAKSREDVFDHGCNFAFTAWHMCEWVARGVKRTREHHASLAIDERPADYTRALPDDTDLIQDLARKQCPDIEILQSVLNVTKHAAPNKHTLDAGFVVIGTGSFAWFAAEPDEAGQLPMPTFTEEELAAATHAVTIVLRQNGGNRLIDLVDLCVRVEEFWHDLVHSHCIE